MKKIHFIFIAIALFILSLPIIVIGVVYLFLSKNIFDNPDFWYGYMAYFGTACLAMVSLWQNENANETNRRLNEENLYYQKVVSQKLYPIIGIKNLTSAKCKETYCPINEVPNKQTYNRYSTWNSASCSNCWKERVSVNLDCENTEYTSVYKKPCLLIFAIYPMRL